MEHEEGLDKKDEQVRNRQADEEDDELEEYLDRKREKFQKRLKHKERAVQLVEQSPSPERSETPKRAVPTKRKERSSSPQRRVYEKYVPPSTRNAPVPHGFKRSECPVGHRCSKALCYTHVNIKGAVWDRSVYPRPYFPPKKPAHWLDKRQ